MKIAVIGSGPSGWIAAKKLTESGHEVSVFDPALDDSLMNSLGIIENKKLIAGKELHGSDYPYRPFPHGPGLTEIRAKTLNSFAQGGLSLVWGATMLPYSASDVKNWPINFSDLDDGYKFVSKNVPISSQKDSLSNKYFCYSSQAPLVPSNRITRIVDQLSKQHGNELIIGYSRLAVKVSDGKSDGCIYCGQCLTGCPSDFIWHAPKIDSSKVKNHVKNRVISIREEVDGISIQSMNRTGQLENSEHFERVILGAGPIESFRILATSRMVSNKAVMKDSNTFFLPIYLSRRFRLPPDKTFTLSQAFVRIEPHNLPAAQLQLYEFSPDLVERAKKILPLGSFIPDYFLKLVLRRMVVAIGYLDSGKSTPMEISLTESGNVLIKSKKLNIWKLRKRIAPYIKIFNKKSRKLGIRPLFLFAKFSRPGEGVHFGSWLPMGSEADLLGRPRGHKLIHVIDSSVLPTIPAGAMTFTVMANSSRIVDQLINGENL
jgi:choline dehydrogenase-like flavoprotein